MPNPPRFQATLALEFLDCATSKIFFRKTEIYDAQNNYVLVLWDDPANKQLWSGILDGSPTRLLHRIVCEDKK
jgi:hypothetical protein